MSWILQNHQLEVEIESATAERGTRFDRTASVRQVRMKHGGHTFCMPESMKPGRGSGGFGLYNEFGIFKPVGFDDCVIGDKFPKLGVGLLTRLDQSPYDFFELYPLDPFTIIVHEEPESIGFEVLPKDCRGYAVHLHKRLSLHGSLLRIEYKLANLGVRPINTQEYVHNFIGIGANLIGPDYTLRFPTPLSVLEIEPNYTPQLLQLHGDTIRWNESPSEDFYVRFHGMGGPYPFSWELRHEPSGVGVRESGDFPVSMVALWGRKHVVSPEMFVDIHLEPGQTMQWQRSYEFFQSY